ncbi:hypothetical protein B0F88_110181 [Methylobacter tundripaludum]|uniref:Uncharacterized protein n=1 Tax=Methylobacter tundripaludum TaxID=173365 RepID=A0A2S6GVZ7_9GAMM|nr:hypothetical protein B0F88_110181 [Methylobacter tundripaludum]
MGSRVQFFKCVVTYFVELCAGFMPKETYMFYTNNKVKQFLSKPLAYIIRNSLMFFINEERFFT